MKLGDNHRLAPALSWELGPPDEDDNREVFECPGCGVLYASKGFFVAHDFAPCPGGFHG